MLILLYVLCKLSFIYKAIYSGNPLIFFGNYSEITNTGVRKTVNLASVNSALFPFLQRDVPFGTNDLFN